MGKKTNLKFLSELVPYSRTCNDGAVGGLHVVM